MATQVGQVQHAPDADQLNQLATDTVMSKKAIALQQIKDARTLRAALHALENTEEVVALRNLLGAEGKRIDLNGVVGQTEWREPDGGSHHEMFGSNKDTLCLTKDGFRIKRDAFKGFKHLGYSLWDSAQFLAPERVRESSQGGPKEDAWRIERGLTSLGILPAVTVLRTRDLIPLVAGGLTIEVVSDQIKAEVANRIRSRDRK